MTDTNKTPYCRMHEALVSYLYNEATGEESHLLEAHIKECASCTEEFEAFGRVRNMLRQWQLDDMPITRIAAEPESKRRSAIAVLKELFSVTPIWVKACGALAMAVVVLAVMGTEVRVGRDGVSLRADLLRRNNEAQVASTVSNQNTNDPASAVNLERVRAEVRTLVNALILESEREQKQELRAQLVSLESQLQDMHSADLAKLQAKIQAQQSRLKTIERDIDRREGSDLSDILFSDLLSKPDKAGAAVDKGGD